MPANESRPPRAPRGQDKPRASHKAMENGVWFKITVGRERKADPKWLLPEICRQGEITKQDIGAIRVFTTETRFEVAPEHSERFAALVAEHKKGGVRIFPAPDGEPPVDRAVAPEHEAQVPQRREDKPRHKPKPGTGKGYFPKNKKKKK